MTATYPARRQLLTTTQAAERASVHRLTIIRWCNAGHLPCSLTPGGQRRIDAADVDALLAEVAR